MPIQSRSRSPEASLNDSPVRCTRRPGAWLAISRCGCRQRDERVPSAWRSSVPSQQPSRNDDLLDLAGALIKSKDANVAVESLDAVVGDIPGTAENLHGLVGDAPNHLRRKILGAGGFHRDALSRIALSRGIEHH